MAYIVKGNRQVIKREVSASKRFKIESDTYIIKESCIFWKNIDGKLETVAYYHEGNPNPYNFKDKINKGLTSKELDDFYADDFHTIVIELKPKDRSLYILFVVVMTLCLAVMFDIIGVINYFF